MNLKSSLEEFLNNCVEKKNDGTLSIQISDIFSLLLSLGCDYFELAYFYSRIKQYTREDISALITSVPTPQKVLKLNNDSIHAMIPRWTATKYHTAPIQEVLADIRNKIVNRVSGIYVYHSNLNPRNARSPDDPYILLVSKKESVFLDINRRRAFRITHTKEE